MKILIASQDWDYRFARPQHFARILGEQHRVTYLSTGPDIKSRTRDALRGETIWRPLCYRISPNVQAFSAFHPIGHTSPEGIRQDCRLNARLARLLYPQAFDCADIGITTNPVHYDTIRNLRWKRLVYDCLDRYEGFFPEGSELQEFVLERERRLLKEADFVFVSSRLLYDEKSQIRKVHYLPHGVDIEHFQNHATPAPEELRSIRNPIVGFVGGIEHWVDLSWVAAAAEDLPEVSFVLVGDVRVPVSELPQRTNIRFLGYRPYAEVSRYINAFSVCIVPFRINDLTAAVNPIKVLEYFALGRPVVSTYMPELEHYLPYIALVRTVAEFIARVKDALATDTPGLRRARQEIAESRSWRRITQNLVRVIQGEAASTEFAPL